MSEANSQKAVIPDVTQILLRAIEKAREVDSQVGRLEKAAGRDRDKSDTEDSPSLEPCPYSKLEQTAATLYDTLESLEINLRREVTLLLGDFES